MPNQKPEKGTHFGLSLSVWVFIGSQTPGIQFNAANNNDKPNTEYYSWAGKLFFKMNLLLLRARLHKTYT